MSVILVPSPENPSTSNVVGPSGGDPRTSASVTVPMQTLTDQIAYIWQSITGSISQAVSLLSSLTVGGSITATGPITSSGTVTSAAVAASGGITAVTLAASGSCTAGTLSIGGNATVTSLLTAGTISAGSVTATSGGLACNGNISSSAGSLSVAGTISSGSTATIGGPLQWTGTGRLVERLVVTTGTVGAVTAITAGNVFWLSSAVAGSSLQIVDAGSQIGDTFTVINESASNLCAILAPSAAGGGTLFSVKNLGGSSRAATFLRVATNQWVLLSACPA